MAIVHPFSFHLARPVWQTGREKESNVTTCAVATLPQANATAYVAASTSFILTVNGKFAFHGPSRCAHGIYKVDAYDLTPFLSEPTNVVVIRCVGYNVDAYSYVDQPSFLCAELLTGSEVVAATGAHGFRYFDGNERIQKTVRYSFQRPFAEAYRLKPGAFTYDKPECPVSPTEDKHFITADVPHPDGITVFPTPIFSGKVALCPKGLVQHDRAIDRIGEIIHGFRYDELEDHSGDEHLNMEFAVTDRIPPKFPLVLADGQFTTLKFERDYCGILSFDITIRGEGKVYFFWDEILDDNDLCKPHRMETTDILPLVVTTGTYRVITAEPYVMKYMQVASLGCTAEVANLALHKITFPESLITKDYIGSDPQLRRIYDAARESFITNAVDIYMDCASRERAGWLCDGFFIGRTEYALTGKSRIERAFLLNFLLPEKFDYLPDGMLPMCYPADFFDKNFIPNWAMWYYLQLDEYFTRTGDAELVAAAREKACALLAWFRRYENTDGLLEKLPGWVFVEWSQANALVQEVNFPTNMVYARFKQVLGKLYDDAGLMTEAEQIRAYIRENTVMPDGFFCDNANRVDGKLVLSGERTEVCQYYAFFFDVVTPESHPTLWKTLVDHFGFGRTEYPEIWPANAFVGNYMRIDLLMRYGYREKLEHDIRSYFDYMALKTGTLWEHDSTVASCNHGFASYVIAWFDGLGLLK